jgi:PPE-repeat protein
LKIVLDVGGLTALLLTAGGIGTGGIGTGSIGTGSIGTSSIGTGSIGTGGIGTGGIGTGGIGTGGIGTGGIGTGGIGTGSVLCQLTSRCRSAALVTKDKGAERQERDSNDTRKSWYEAFVFSPPRHKCTRCEDKTSDSHPLMEALVS